MKTQLTLIGVSIVLLCSSCHKTDPLDNPQYIGTWVATNYDDNCDYIIVIKSNGTGTADDADSGLHCDLKPISGECKIKNRKIKIGDASFPIISEPESVAGVSISTPDLGTFTANMKMVLTLHSSALMSTKGNYDFYKVP